MMRGMVKGLEGSRKSRGGFTLIELLDTQDATWLWERTTKF